MAYDSITLPARTRHELPFSTDLYDLGNRVNIHGQRKVVDPEVTVLWEGRTVKEDIVQLGWKEGARTMGVLPEKGVMAGVCRGVCDDVDEVTKSISHGDIVTERYYHPRAPR